MMLRLKHCTQAPLYPCFSQPRMGQAYKWLVHYIQVGDDDWTVNSFRHFVKRFSAFVIKKWKKKCNQIQYDLQAEKLVLFYTI